jgi:lipid-binding SYLF domain-containing protein
MQVHAAYAAAEPTIERDAQAALESLYANSSSAIALREKAKAVLVFPDIRKAAFIVGGQSGEGVMFRNGKAAGHYRVDGLLAGTEAGMQSYAYVMFFMSDAAVHKLRYADGWDIGADPKIVVVDAGSWKERSTTTPHVDVNGFVFNGKGLMGGIELQGKITRTAR